MKRRDFIQDFSLLSGSVVFGMNGISVQAFGHPLLLNMGQTNGKILVIIQMFGGNDGLNTVIPFEDSTYYSKRPNLAIAKNSVIPLVNNMGLHSSLLPMKELYDKGKVAVVQNVGYANPNRSHFRSTDIYLSASDASEFIYDGWVGRFLSQTFPDFPMQQPEHPMAIQLGSVESLLLQSQFGSMGTVFENPNTFYQLVSGLSTDNDPPPNTLAGDELKYLKQVAVQSKQYAGVIKDKADKAVNTVTYPNTNLGRQLAIVAELIAGGLNTPVYLVSIGGFDTHANQLTAHANLLKQIADAVLAFQKDIENQKVDDKVALMTFSEFGRRINENGSAGTDHGTAYPLFVVGKNVKGGLLGSNPNLTDIDNNGDIKFKYDFRQIYTTVMQDHLGLSSAEAKSVLFKDFSKIELFGSNVTALSGLEEDIAELKQNYPNPFQGATTIEYELRKQAKVRLSVMDLEGKEISELVNESQTPGVYKVNFRADDLASGLYICNLQINQRRRVKQMLVAN